MKFILQSIAALLLPFCCLATDGYTIKGKVTGIISGYITVLEYPVEGAAPLHEQLPERVRIVNGEFSISGKVSHPGLAYIKVSTRQLTVILENADYVINGDLKELQDTDVKGSPLNDQYQQYRDSKISPLVYAEQHPDKQISAFLVHLFAREYNDLKKGYEGLDIANKGSWFGNEIHKKLAEYKRTESGKAMPDFTMTTPEGKQLSVSDMAGKVVVLDFWASWCAPCREFIPTMRGYYNTYKPKGVEFVAVSFDDSVIKWKDAIAETKMEWKQGLAAGGFGKNAPVPSLLNISSIPHVIVVGKDGKIAAWLDFAAKSRLPEILEQLM